VKHVCVSRANQRVTRQRESAAPPIRHLRRKRMADKERGREFSKTLAVGEKKKTLEGLLFILRAMRTQHAKKKEKANMKT